jgi:arylsulfatase A-like enzyme
MIDEGGTRTVEGYATDIVTDLALDWLDGLGDEEPFCMMVHHKAPHRPWLPDEKHKHLYADGSIPEPDTFFDDHETRSRAVRGVHMTIADDMGADDLKQDVPAHLRGPENRQARMRWKYQIYMRDYLQCVQSIDDNVGRILDRLEDKGFAENTLVVYTSDQGFFLGDHGWFDKRLMFDQSLQMPMLIQWPAEIEPGSRCEAIVTNVDFAATFLDACGIDAAAELPSSQGRSFLPLLRGEEVEDWPDAAYYRYWEHDDPIHAAPAHYGIRTAEHKLIHYYGAGLGVPGASDRVFEPEWELYDLKSDPTEVRNVADDPAYAGVRAGLEAKLAEYQQHYRDEPYRGPDTPRPEWGPYDRETLERVKRVFAR